MRNLKKILALVLALMMVLSMMVTASASFNDDADITHTEAVDVMVAAGILNGDENGNFRPTDALERSSAAKLIAYLMLQEDIELLDKTATEFSDVSATHWASGYISYVAEHDIVVGDGTGAYNPNDAVNGYSFLKMVILALCNGNVEMIEDLDTTAHWSEDDGVWTTAPFTGAYTLKVRLAIAELKADDNIDLLAGLEDVSLNDALSREHAAQIVFNALLGSGDLATTYRITKSTYDVAGLTYSKWIYTAANDTEVDVTEATQLDTYVESFAAGTKLADAAKAVGITTSTDKTVYNYSNTFAAGSASTDNVLASSATVALAANLDVYMTAAGNYKFMTTTETLAVATVADAAETSGTYKGLYKWTFTGTAPATAYAAKDAYTDGATYLVVVGDGNLVADVKVPETVQGKILSKGADYVRIDGIKYTVKGNINVTLGNEYVLVLATDGTVLLITTPAGAPVVESPEVLVYVLGTYVVTIPAVEGTDPVYNEYGEEVVPGSNGKDEYKMLCAQAYDLNGTVADYVIDANYLGEQTTYVEVNAMAAIEFDENGIADLDYDPDTAVKVENLTPTAIKFNNGTSNNYYVTGAEYTSIVGNKGTVNTGAGTKAAAILSGNAYAVFTGEGTNKTVSAIYYQTSPVTPSYDPDLYLDMFLLKDSTSTDVAYVEIDKNEDGEIADSEKLNIYTHEVYINGEKTTITTETETIAAGAHCYVIDEYGYYVLTEDEVPAISSYITNVYNGLVTINGYQPEDIDVTDITVVDLSTKGNGTLDIGDRVVYFFHFDEDDNWVIDVIYIIDWSVTTDEEIAYALANAYAGTIITLDGEAHTLPSEMNDGLIIDANGGNIAFEDNKLSSSITIQNANFAANVYMNGYVDSETRVGTVVFENCKFTGAVGIGYGTGADALHAAKVVVKNCVFECTNIAIYTSVSESLTITGCTFNSGKVQLGAPSADAVFTITNCEFNSEHTGSIWGERGVRVYGTTTFTNCELNNSVVVMAGSADLPVTFIGCTKDGNAVTSDIIAGGNVPVLVIK